MHKTALAASLAASLCFSVSGQDSPAQTPPDSPAPAVQDPAVQDPAGQRPTDFVELKNGDRITGTVSSITPDGVAISSPALGDLVVPLGDVASMRSSSSVAVAISGADYEELSTPVQGFDGENFSFGDAGQSRTVPASQVVEPKMGVIWNASISVGGAAAFGNTERRSANADARLSRRTEDNRFTGRFNWNYAEDDSEVTTGGVTSTRTTVTQRTVFGSAQWDEFLNECLYAYGNTSGEFDERADLRLRFIAGVGLGYQVVDRDDYKLSLEAGLNYINEDNVDTPLGGPLSPPARDPDAEYLAARGAVSLDWSITDDIVLSSQGEVFPSLEDSSDVTARGDTRLRVTLTEKMFAQFQWVIDYDNTPATGRERVDHLLTASVGWSL